MSKVSIEGNVSGTGTFTIAAPNSNSNYTLNLPASSGDLMTTATSISGSQIPDGAVTTAKIADSNVTVAKISATGTPSASTFLNGAGAWSTPGGGFSNMQVFTSSGTFTVPAGVTKVKVTVVGGGGSGQGSIGYTTYAGNAGGTSSFGAYCSATGGAGATTSATSSVAGGAGSGGSVNISGGFGMPTWSAYASNSYGSMQAGSSILGVGGKRGVTQTGSQSYSGWAVSPTGYGAGGIGSNQYQPTGAGGGYSQGVFSVTSGAAITVTVGAGGASAGGSQAGTAGIVIVEY